MTITHANSPGISINQLAAEVDGTVRGSDAVTITGVNSIADGAEGDITFISTQKYADRWPQSQASAAVITFGVEVDDSTLDRKALIEVADAELAMITILELFAPPPALPEPGVHPTAWISDKSEMGEDVRIGPHVSVEAGAKLADAVTLCAGVRIYPEVSIGSNTILHANTVVRERCVIGCNVIMHPNVSIGADGFGYRPSPDGSRLLKVPHIGHVVIEDHVELGANTCIDRGKFGATVVGRGVKIDNQVQVAHNCRIGSGTVIAGQTGIAGSTTIGAGVQIAGGTGVIEHLTIGDGARIGATALVMRDVEPGESVTGTPADSGRDVMRQWIALRKLPDWMKKVSRRLEL